MTTYMTMWLELYDVFMVSSQQSQESCNLKVHVN